MRARYKPCLAGQGTAPGPCSFLIAPSLDGSLTPQMEASPTDTCLFPSLTRISAQGGQKQQEQE